MNNARISLVIALLACTAGAQAQSLAVRVDAPDWGQVQSIQAMGSKGTVWTEHCYTAGVQDNSTARYINGRGTALQSKAARQSWLASISADDLLHGRLGPVVRVNENTAAARMGQVLLRTDQEGALERDLACLAQATPVGELTGHEVVVASGGRHFKWQQPAGWSVPQIGAWVRPPANALMSGYIPGHAPPAPPRGDWADTYYIGYPYAERYSAPVVPAGH